MVQLRHEISTLPVESRSNLLTELNQITARINHLHQSIVDVKESINIVVGTEFPQRVFCVPLSLLSKQPGSMLWRAVQRHLSDSPAELLRFPTAREEYFQYVLDIIKQTDTWRELKTRSRLFDFISQLDYFIISGTTALIDTHQRQKQEERRQQTHHLRQVRSLAMATQFLPSSVCFHRILMSHGTRMGIFGMPLYRYELRMDHENYQRELDQALASEVIHDLNTLTFGTNDRYETETIPVPWPHLSVDVTIDWLTPATFRPDQKTVMQTAARIRNRYPTVKASLCVRGTRVHIRVQPRNGDSRERSYLQCCLDYDLERLDDISCVHNTTCVLT